MHYIRTPATVFVMVLSLQLCLTWMGISADRIQTSDSAEYFKLAENLFERGVWYCGELSAETDASLYSRRPPGYSVFLFFSSIGLRIPILTLFLQAVLHALSAVLTWEILSKGFGVRLRAWSMCVIWLFMPSSWIYPQVFMSETLLQFLLVSGVYFLLKFHTTNTKSSFWTGHLLLVFAWLTKPVAIFCWIPVLIWQAAHVKSEARRNLVVASILHIALIAIVLVRNEQQTGVNELSSVGRKLMINYTIPSILAVQHDDTTAKNQVIRFQESLQRMSYAESSAKSDSMIRSIMTENLLATGFAYLKGAVFFLTDPGRWDLEMRFGSIDTFSSFQHDGLRTTWLSRPLWYWTLWICSVVGSLV
ncbi:MAG: hypothetical protein ACKORE_04770, partial [Bacteroidota bacterium]